MIYYGKTKTQHHGIADETTIALDLSNYESVRIVFKVNASTTTMGESRYIIREALVGTRTNVDQITPYVNQDNVVIRTRTFIVDTEGITFGSGTNHVIGANNSHTVPDNNALIPYQIYGVR